MTKELKAYKKNYVFGKGDQVRYGGPLSAGEAPQNPRVGLSDAAWFFGHASSSSARYVSSLFRCCFLFSFLVVYTVNSLSYAPSLVCLFRVLAFSSRTRHGTV